MSSMLVPVVSCSIPVAPISNQFWVMAALSESVMEMLCDTLKLFDDCRFPAPS